MNLYTDRQVLIQISMETMRHFTFVGAPKSLQMVTAAMKLKEAYSWKESYHQPRQHIKKQRYYYATKIHLVKAMVSPVVTYGCESCTIKLSAEELTLLNYGVREDS